MGVLIIIIYFFRILLGTFLIKFADDMNDSDYENSMFSKEKKIFKTKEVFAMWFIPFYGWINVLIQQFKKLYDNIGQD